MTTLEARRVAVVTGCAGFIGSHLCEALLREGWRVRGVDALTDYYPAARKRANLAGLTHSAAFTFSRADLARDPLGLLVEGADAIFHLAAQPGVRGSFGEGFETYARCNVVGTQRLLEAAASARVPPRVVYASSSSVYGDAAIVPTTEAVERRPVSPYGMTKVATEDLADAYFRTAGLETIGLRYFTVYGPRQRPDMAFSRFIERALGGKPLVVHGDGRQIRDFTFVADAVAATVAAAERGVPGAVYNVGGGSPVTLDRVVEILGRLLSCTLPVERTGAVRGDVRCTTADTTRCRRELGVRPSTPIERGLAHQVAWTLRSRPRATRPGVEQPRAVGAGA